jgi:hypothetical protein
MGKLRVAGVILDDHCAPSGKGAHRVATKLTKREGKITGAKNSDWAKRHVPSHQARVTNRGQTS